MAKINVRAKGQRAEREAIKLLQPVVDKVYWEMGSKAPVLERNQMQTHRGGYDIVGIDWMSLEIKHQEQLSVEDWWEQCIMQTKPGQIPVLMYKQNNVKWRVRIVARVGDRTIPVEIGVEDFLMYFEYKLREKLINVRLVWGNG